MLSVGAGLVPDVVGANLVFARFPSPAREATGRDRIPPSGFHHRFCPPCGGLQTSDVSLIRVPTSRDSRSFAVGGSSPLCISSAFIRVHLRLTDH